MANLPEETLTIIYCLQKKLFQLINDGTTTDYRLVENYGETESTLPELEELQNIKEKAKDCYNRLSRLLLIIAEAQPIASQDTLDLLYRSIQQTEITIDALDASTQEIKKNWSLL